MKKIAIVLSVFSVLLLVSCSDENLSDVETSLDSKSLFEQMVEIHNSQISGNLKRTSPRPQPDTFGDCIVYSSIVNPATFKPESDPFDELYAIPNGSFYNGVPLISESKPGDQDYNGGRWHLNVLKEEVDPAKYSGACAVEDLDLADFNSTEMYFSCPMRPRRN